MEATRLNFIAIYIFHIKAFPLRKLVLKLKWIFTQQELPPLRRKSHHDMQSVSVASKPSYMPHAFLETGFTIKVIRV